MAKEFDWRDKEVRDKYMKDDSKPKGGGAKDGRHSRSRGSDRAKQGDDAYSGSVAEKRGRGQAGRASEAISKRRERSADAGREARKYVK